MDFDGDKKWIVQEILLFLTILELNACGSKYKDKDSMQWLYLIQKKENRFYFHLSFPGSCKFVQTWNNLLKTSVFIFDMICHNSQSIDKVPRYKCTLQLGQSISENVWYILSKQFHFFGD